MINRRLILVILSGLAVLAAFAFDPPFPVVWDSPAPSVPRIITSETPFDFSDAQVWTSTKTMTMRQNAVDHFHRHGREMGFQKADDYITAARMFLHTPPPGTQSKFQEDGDIVRFHAGSALFGVMRADGTPRTFFKMNPNKRGGQSNQDYFDAQ